MVSFYPANYPRPPYKEETYPPVKCPVLTIHGLDDLVTKRMVRRLTEER